MGTYHRDCGQPWEVHSDKHNPGCPSDAKKFYRRVVKVELLSDEPFPDEMSLEQIAAGILDGPWSGRLETFIDEEVAPRRMARLLLRQASDPEFLGLSEDGKWLVA